MYIYIYIYIYIDIYQEDFEYYLVDFVFSFSV